MTKINDIPIFRTSWIAISILFCLFSCSKNSNTDFLGRLEVGKYEIIQYREYPNGFKDTLHWYGYGPHGTLGTGSYTFSLDEMTTNGSSWTFTKVGLYYSSHNDTIYESRSYKFVSVTTGTNEAQINYTFTDSNIAYYPKDSATGIISIKRLPL